MHSKTKFCFSVFLLLLLILFLLFLFLSVVCLAMEFLAQIYNIHNHRAIDTNWFTIRFIFSFFFFSSVRLYVFALCVVVPFILSFVASSFVLPFMRPIHTKQANSHSLVFAYVLPNWIWMDYRLYLCILRSHFMLIAFLQYPMDWFNVFRNSLSAPVSFHEVINETYCIYELCRYYYS